MERLNREVIQKIIQVGEVFDIGQVSFQLKELLTLISEGKEIKKEKFAQISDEALSFLQEKAQFLEENELRHILLSLLTEPKPENQKHIIEIFEEFLGESKEEIKKKINKEKWEAQKFTYLNEYLERLRNRGKWYALIIFYIPRENQVVRPDIFEEALEGAINRGWDEDIEALLYFYTPSENQKIRPDILEDKILDIAIRRSRPEVLEALLYFYTPSENQKIRPDILERALEIAIERQSNRDIHSLTAFYTPPANRKIRPDIFKKTLEILGIQEEEFEKSKRTYTTKPYASRKAFDILVRREDWDVIDLIYSYTPPENKLKLTQITQDKIIKSIKTIADENLRAEVLEIYIKYFRRENSPLSLFLLSKNEDLPVLISAYNLGIQPEVVLSWNLTQEERETILPILVDLNKHNIRFPFPFIFYPREKIKEKKKYNELIIDYLRTLDFIANLSQILQKVKVNLIVSLIKKFKEKTKGNLIKKHFKKIEDLVKKYDIAQTTTEIPFSFLRETLNSIKELKKEALQKLKQILKIQGEVTEEEWERFIKESKYLNQLITLAIHYSQKYRDGLPLLGKIATAIIKGNYFDLRYNLNDPITQEQLAPLLESIKDEQKKQRILDIWRGNYFSFHFQSTEEIKREAEAVKNYNSILSHLRSQIIDHKHYEGILDLIPGLDKKDRQILSTVFEHALNGEAVNLGQIREILRKYKLYREKAGTKEESEEEIKRKQEKRIDCFIGIIQLLKDLNLKKKPEEYLFTIKRLEKNIRNNWPELLETEIVGTDILNYLKNQFEQSESLLEKITRKRILASYFTDHPKTLLEIGAYPVATCQDYRSKGNLNSRLLGYIFDAHIKALVARVIEIKENISVEDLERAQIEIDDNNERITIILKDGRKIEASVSKPIARRIVMLGKLNNQPVLLLEPIYSRGGRTSEEIEYLNKPINKLLEALRKEGVNIGTTTSHETITPRSHNPAGYYRDI